MAATVGRVTLILVVVLIAGATTALMIHRVFDARQAPPIVISDLSLERPIVVMVDGAVQRPGMYSLDPGARLQQAVDAAGGPAPEADLSSLNMATLLADEDRITIPAVPSEAEATPVFVSVPAGGATGADAGVITTDVPGVTANDGSGSRAEPGSLGAPVNINTADATALDKLPGIGPALAGRIVAYREEYGPFQSVDDLDAVSGISPRMVDELRPLITV